MTSDRLFLCNKCTALRRRRKHALRAPKCCGERMTEVQKSTSGLRLKRNPFRFSNRDGVRNL